ncbi:predicted protein [Plenodomus lingam JN3]|uniref:Predicted protein n=1 Tax=Leptosphaeria maculans (strain JN3 / isolate v23.1.3 / race Av1-4-5-6-7-8) TaxID=985895 RepID=E4ZLF3_LEPMJ|nr:predicted protein [Plenodomus lingam JN3]CBX92312.1 predicted protein [Plenodomus lingam JN3]
MFPNVKPREASVVLPATTASGPLIDIRLPRARFSESSQPASQPASQHAKTDRLTD